MTKRNPPFPLIPPAVVEVRHDPRVFYDDTRLYEMPRERSFDIDDELEFAIVELVMQNKI